MTEQTTAPELSFREQVEQAVESAPEPVAPVETAAPEPEAAAPEGDEGQEKVEKVVPLAALHEERRRRQELQAEALENRRMLQQLQQQQVAIFQEMQRRQNPPVPPVDENVDPLGAINQRQKITQDQLAQLNQRMAQEAQQRQQTEALRQIETNVARAESSFVKEKPDYHDALNHLRQMKFREYTAVGMSDADAAQAVARDAWQLSQFCLQKGVNPAEHAYRIAEALGYTPKAKPQDKVAMQREGMKASTPSGGGGQGGGRLSLDALAKMSPKDFEKATAGEKWKQLMQNA